MKPPSKTELVPATNAELDSGGEPPVVARLVIEIRSDGTQTIARGVLEDVQAGEETAIEARGTSPIQLAFALARALTQVPKMAARSALRGLLGRGREK